MGSGNMSCGIVMRLPQFKNLGAQQTERFFDDRLLRAVESLQVLLETGRRR
mgnify:CR=1 FL=1